MNEKFLEHAWRYFELHASQRIAVFNFFIVFSGILCTGLAASLQASRQIAILGVVLGALLTFLAFVFWKLDQRTSFLIKHAEDIICNLEPDEAPIFSAEAVRTASDGIDQKIWTYGNCFRTIFLVMALIGICGAGLSGLKAIGIVDLSQQPSSD